MSKPYANVIPLLTGQANPIDSISYEIKGFMHSLGARFMSLKEFFQRNPNKNFSLSILRDGLYFPDTDEIVIIAQFQPASLIALHELIHWTGAENRMKREYVVRAVNRPGTGSKKDLHTEEATAQIGTLRLAEYFGIADEIAHSYTCDYMQSLTLADMSKANNDADKTVMVEKIIDNRRKNSLSIIGMATPIGLNVTGDSTGLQANTYYQADVGLMYQRDLSDTVRGSIGIATRGNALVGVGYNF
jgi:Zincin-like metallopeptidase